MDDKIHCRVCGAKIGRFGWASHVMSHKRQYCKDLKIPEYKAHEVDWESVVRHYNPSAARSEMQTSLNDQEKPKDLNFWLD